MATKLYLTWVPSATLTGLHGIGTTSWTVSGTTGWLPGMTVIFEPGAGNQETLTILTVPTGTTFTTAPSANSHANGVTVRADYSFSSDVDWPLSTTAGSSPQDIYADTITGPATIRLGPYGNVGQPLASFWFQAAAVTISGTVTYNLWGYEFAMTTNAGLRVEVARCDSAGAFISYISQSSRGTEMAQTTPAVNNWTATPTSTTLTDGDWIRVQVFAVDAGGTMAAAAAGALVRINGSVAQLGDSWVQFNETVTAGAPAATKSPPFPYPSQQRRVWMSHRAR